MALSDIDKSPLYIDSTNSRVGIGTTSANKSSSSTALTVNTSSAGNYSALELSSGDTLNWYINSNNTAVYDVTAGTRPRIFYTNGAERMRIDSSGNVGIGTSSPSAKAHIQTASSGSSVASSGDELFVEGSGDAGITVGAGNTSKASLFFADNGDSAAGRIRYDHSDNSMQFGTSGQAERMRIDSVGRVLIGGTSTAPGFGNTVTGLNLSNDGRFFASVTSESHSLNRNSTNGDILQFRKDGTTVGSIASRANVVSSIILDPRSGGGGLTGGGAALYPTDNAGAPSNGVLSLGDPSARWQNLYLSGGVVFGATGGAVTGKTLDDYEEGTWTPTIGVNGFSQAITSTSLATYVKIGKIVHITFAVNLAASGYASSYSLFTGLPFASSPASTNGRYAGGSISGGGDGSGVYISGSLIYLFPSHNTSSAGWTSGWNVSASYLTA